MDLETFNKFCNNLPATEKVIQWGDSHVWKVGDKIFALCGPWGPDRPDKSFKIAFKCSDMSFKILCDADGINASPYLGRYKWVLVQDADALTVSEYEDYIRHAHALAAAKLTKKAQKELGLTDLVKEVS